MNNEKGFLSLLQSIDAFFPIGAFTLSNGLEDYVVRNRITSCEELADYLRQFLQIFPYNDLGLMSLAYRHAGNLAYLCELDQIAGAVKSPREVRVGSSRMCTRYLKARMAMEDCPGELFAYREQILAKEADGYHPIALGIYGAVNSLEEKQLLIMYGYSVISAIVNNAVKLVPLSQMKGQRILYESLEELELAVTLAQTVELCDIGVTGSACDIHCMNHEILYSRQYMS